MADEATATAILQEETLRELGLSEQPFVDGKKPHRFTDSALQKTRASLEQHARFGESVHLLLGETGAGKTVLLSQLIKHCKSSIKPFVAKGSNGFVAEAFLTAVHTQLGGDQCDDMTGLVESLAPEFAGLSEQQLSVLLAIDDAHLAPVEEIAELINIMAEFNSGGKITARLLLTGAPKLKSSLEAIAREYDGMTFDPSVSIVSALSESQMRDYLSSRLNHAGHTDVFPFTEKALAKIHRESAGLPAEINTGAAHYLNTVYANVTPANVGGGLLAALGWPLVALGAAAVGLIAWGLSMFITGGDSPQVVRVNPPTIVANAPVEIRLIDDDADDANSSEQTITDATQPSNDLNSAIKDLADTNLQNGQGNAADSLLRAVDEPAAVDTDSASDIAQSLANTAQNTASQLASDPLIPSDSGNSTSSHVNETVVATEQVEVQTIEEVTTQVTTEAANLANSSASQPNEELPTTDASTDSEVITVTESVVVVSEDANANDSNKPVTSGNDGVAITTSRPSVVESEKVDITDLPDSDALSNNDSGIAVPLPSVNGASNTVKNSEPRIQRAVENERWVLFQEPTHFTVQLATSRERNYILELAQGLSESPVAIYPFRTTDSQNPVFGLLSGLYKTRTEAINAVDQMPNDTKRFGVWIRPISDLQAAIKKNPK